MKPLSNSANYLAISEVPAEPEPASCPVLTAVSSSQLDSRRCLLLRLEARPESPSRLQTANEARSATPEVLDVEGLQPRPSDAASRTSSRFSLREGFPAGPPTGRILLCATDSADFAPAELAHIRDQLGQIYLDRSPGVSPDDFAKDLVSLRREGTCASCPELPSCPGVFAPARLEHGFAASEDRLRRIISSLRGRVLDVGVGHPRSLLPLMDPASSASDTGAVLPFDYVGLEPDAARCQQLRSRWPQLHVLALQAEEPGLASQLGVFDHVMVLRSYNHLRDPAQTAANLKALLRPGGSLLVVDNTAFGLLRSRRRLRELERAERAGSARFEHYRNHDSLQASAALVELATSVLVHEPVTPETANQWILHLRVGETTRDRSHPDRVAAV